MIRAFAREEFQEEKFAAENAVYAENSNKLFKLTGLTEPSICADHHCYDCVDCLVCFGSSS